MPLKKHIPNAVTSLNLLSGVLGVAAVCEARIDIAFYLMIAGAVFDFCDGLLARALNAYSDKGKELDSLADLVTFGVLPALMLFRLMSICTFSTSPLCYRPLLMAVFAGLRLAKFNVDDRQSHGFLGLPVPAAALIAGSLCYFIISEVGEVLGVWATGMVFFPIVAICLGVLMVSEVPMFSFKFSKDDSKALKSKRLSLIICFVAIVAAVAALGLNWSLAVLFSLLAYVLLNLALALFKV